VPIPGILSSGFDLASGYDFKVCFGLFPILKHKNSRKQELALWHLVNRLVPENACRILCNWICVVIFDTIAMITIFCTVVLSVI
jgi:hypothetical protein